MLYEVITPAAGTTWRQLGKRDAEIQPLAITASASQRPQAPVQAHHIAGACALVQPVHVLGHQSQSGGEQAPAGYRLVGRVGARLQRLAATPVVEAPDLLGVGGERLGSGQLSYNFV